MNQKYPIWLRTTAIFLGTVLLYIILVYGKFILMPLAFSALLAMLLEPVSSLFERLRMGRALAIVLSMVVVFAGLGGIFSLLSIQFMQFLERLPEVNEKLNAISSQVLTFFQQNFGISPQSLVDFFQQGLGNVIDQSGQALSTAVGATTSAFITLSLLPIMVFFLMYYKDMFRHFLRMISSEESSQSIDTVITNIQTVTQNYIVGLISVIGILTVLNGVGFWSIGLENALFFGVFAAIWAIVPFIGIVIGSLPALLYAILFSDSLLMPLGVIIVIAIVQFLEGNFITPNIVGSKVSINPFVAFLALLIGGEVWGITGMILFVPFVGILRCIFMEVHGLEPYGYLLGNQKDYDAEQELKNNGNIPESELKEPTDTSV
jgi:predicted PurR-regulated permease PerM